MPDPSKKILLDVSDGPEGFTIYESEHEGVSDWSGTFPALYLTAAIQGANVKLGPFQLATIRERLLDKLKELPPDVDT